MDNDTNTGGFFSDRLETLIAAALQDGVLTDKERELLKRRAEKEGEDWDEVEMIIEARLAEMQPVNSPIIDKSMNVIAQKVKEESSRSDHQESLTTEENGMEMMLMDAKILLPIIFNMLPSMEICDLSPIAKMGAYSYLEELTKKTSKIELSVAIFKDCVRFFMDSKDDDEAKSKMRQLLNVPSNYGNSYGDLLNWKRVKYKELQEANNHRNDSVETEIKYNKLSAEYQEIKKAIIDGANNIHEVESIISESVRQKNEQIEKSVQYSFKIIEDLEKGIAPVEVLDISDGVLKGFIDNLNDIIKQKGKSFYLRNYDIKIITIPDSVRVIQKDAFRGYKSLTEIRFSSDSCLEEIKEGAFMYCINLNSIDFPKSLKSIGEGSFKYCEKLKSVVIPNSVELIEADAFFGCKYLCDVTLPETLKMIGDYAFCGCALKEIVIPDSVEEIGRNVFAGTQLGEICFPKELRKIGQLSNGDRLKKLRKLDFSKVTKLETIPEEFIGDVTPKLRELVLPMGVKNIEEGIGVINLKRLFLPPTIEKVEDLHKGNLDIYCFAPQIEELGMMIESIKNAYYACTLYVLPEYVESYKAQRAAEDLSEDLLIIDVIPEEFRYYYDN